MLRALLNAQMYFPAREIAATPADAGMEFDELWIDTGDGERLGAWWIAARAQRLGHLLLCHGNAGNIGDRVLHAALLTAAGFDVLAFDYRGYGASSGRPNEQGTYRDAHAALARLSELPGVDAARVFYLGESLGGAVALELALAHPPAGLALLSTFRSVRALARRHFPFLPGPAIPDAYPNEARIGALACPLLVLHGERDRIAPASHGRALYDAAPQPKRLRTIPGAGHNDIVELAGEQLTAEVAAWAREVCSQAGTH